MNISNGDFKQRCTCCPYGYHIDLDFVHFCELFSQNNTVSASKQRRREKRLQRQSMEVLLGLTSPVVWNLEQHLPKIPQEDNVITSSSNSHTAKIVQDALHGAVQDFQETLKRAQYSASADKTMYLPTSEDLEEKYTISAGNSPEMDVCATVVKHSESVMSLSSIGTPSCSPACANAEVPDGIIYSALRVMSPMNDYDTSSITSAASGLSAVALQNIREQMALSLKRMKELEEQVKLVPVLQVQLSVLKEEKRKLLLQLRHEETAKLSSDGISKPDSSHISFIQNAETANFHNTIPRCSKDGETKWTLAFKKNEENDFFVCQYCSKLYTAKEIHSRAHFKDSWSRRGYQDVGVTCSVVTRDVGICHQQPRMYDAETFVNFGETFNGIEHKKISFNSISPFHQPVEEFSNISSSLNCVLPKRDIAVNTCWQTCKIGIQTEVSLCHVGIQKDLPLPKRERARASYKFRKASKLKKFKARIKRRLKKHKTVKKHSVGVMTEMEDMANKPDREKRMLSKIHLESKHQKDASTATLPLMLTSSSKCIDTSEFRTSRLKDAAVNTQKVHFKNVGLGDENINLVQQNFSCQFPCKSDQSKYRDIAINTLKVEMVDVGVGYRMYNFFQKSVSCQCNITARDNKSSYKDSVTNTVKTKVVDVAVGDRNVKLLTKNVSCQCIIQNEHMKPCREPSTNMQKVKMVDVSVGCDWRHLFQSSVSCQCDPLTEENFMNSNKKSPSLSRIPRPVDRSPTSTQHSKEKVNFQYSEKEYIHTNVPASFETMEKINKQVVKQDVYSVGKEYQGASTKLTFGESSESNCQTFLKEHRMELQNEQSLLDFKRFQTGPVSIGLHMLNSSNTQQLAEKESSTTNLKSNLDDNFTFQPIRNMERKKSEPSKEMKAAIKVLNDSLMKTNSEVLSSHAKTAANIIQQEWFHVSSTSSAAPLEVEDYLDFFEETSSKLLEYVVNMTDISGNTAMHYAVSHGNFDVVSILLDSKVCNINQPNAAGYTCVMLVSLANICSETHRQVVRRLFQLADVNVRAQQHGQTALMLAVSHGRLDTVKLLIEAGADMNIQDEDGSTALMCAAEHGHKDIVKQLLSNPDCDVAIADCDGTTALDIAMEAGNRDIGVLIYGRQVFSRSASPHTSRHRRSKSATPMVHTSSPLHLQSSPSSSGVTRARHDKTL